MLRIRICNVFWLCRVFFYRNNENSKQNSCIIFTDLVKRGTDNALVLLSLFSIYGLALNVQLIYSLYACDFSGEQWSRESTVISQCWLQEQSSKMGRFEWWQWIWRRYWCHSVSITQVIKSLLFPEVQAKRRWQFWCEWCLSWTYSYLKSLHTCNLQWDNVETSKSKSTFLAIFSSNIYIIARIWIQDQVILTYMNEWSNFSYV